MREASFLDRYNEIRQHTEVLCLPLKTEDYVVQPIEFVSPPKWHLGHTTWFFETFLLMPYLKGYEEFNKDFSYVFNSYYETVGTRVIRTDRGNLSRPTVEEVYLYRKHVDDAMEKLLAEKIEDTFRDVLVLGFHHEQQHQELLLTDIKYILGHNPLFPPYKSEGLPMISESPPESFICIDEGVYEIGFSGDGFCFDNEQQRHKVYLDSFDMMDHLVTNREYHAFMEAGGYKDFSHWHSDGWEWVKATCAQAPLYWFKMDEGWKHYTLSGLCEPNWDDPVTHINYYEAVAFANWKGMRLPTEAEWEVASSKIRWGKRWEWTESAYLPYPGFKKSAGALGEYNGKFMVNQMVLRGASVATSPGHSRATYRNFFQPNLQWQFTGIRLVK